MADLIYRETARRIIDSPRSKEQMLTVLRCTPPVQPKRQTGHWEEKEVHEKGSLEDIEEWQSAKCSVCGKYLTTPYLYYFYDFEFCPSCGASMTDKKGAQE